jgi:hypothetical protein
MVLVVVGGRVGVVLEPPHAETQDLKSEAHFAASDCTVGTQPSRQVRRSGSVRQPVTQPCASSATPRAQEPSVWPHVPRQVWSEPSLGADAGGVHPSAQLIRSL